MEPIRVSIERSPVAGSLEAAQNMIRTVPGVLSVRLDPGGEELHVDAAGTVDPEEILTAVRKAGLVGALVG